MDTKIAPACEADELNAHDCAHTACASLLNRLLSKNAMHGITREALDACARVAIASVAHSSLDADTRRLLGRGSYSNRTRSISALLAKATALRSIGRGIDRAIVDSGASSHFVNKNTKLDNGAPPTASKSL